MAFSFYPLYFVYHDQWNFHTAYQQEWWWRSNDHKHRGHVHFFFANFNPQVHGQQAHTGSQQYKFRLDDTWSKRIIDKDPNVPENVDYVGTPQWHFYIKEFWRRIYVQPWESIGNDDSQESFVGKKGVKYDASLDIHTHGVFRESKDNFFYMSDMPRTLPVEYYRDSEKIVRDHWLRDEPGLDGDQSWNYETHDQTEWLIPRTWSAGRSDLASFGGDGPPEDNAARRYGYPDENYIYPTLEYQSVIHLDWERENGFLDRPTGDGWEVTISIPYVDKDTGQQLSPFSDDDGNVGVPGNYFHGFEAKHPENVLRYAASNETLPTGGPGGSNQATVYDPFEYVLPSGVLGSKMYFNVPPRLQEDGYWIEQCLGAVVTAKALIKVRDRFDKEYEMWVTDSQFMVQDNFAGTDQNEPEE